MKRTYVYSFATLLAFQEETLKQLGLWYSRDYNSDVLGLLTHLKSSNLNRLR